MLYRHAALLYDGGGLGLWQLRGKEEVCGRNLESHITAFVTNMLGTLEPVLVAEPQSPLAEWQNGRRGSAMYISAGRTPCTLGKTFFEGGFGLLGTRRVSSHQEIPKKNFLKY